MNVSATQGQKKAPAKRCFLLCAVKRGLTNGLKRHFFQHFDADFALGNLAQGSDTGLVFALDLGRMALAEHAGAVAGRQHQVKAVWDFYEAVFNGDTGHEKVSFEGWVNE
jgi:hypothetical protein